ncbi:MAG: hypothetical protein ACOCXX_01130 [Planctomycetota bacterium]
MKNLIYALVIGLVILNGLLVVHLTTQPAQAQVPMGSGGNIIAVTEFMGNNNGVLVVIDTQRKAMLLFELDSDEYKLFRKGGYDLEERFSEIDKLRRKRR